MPTVDFRILFQEITSCDQLATLLRLICTYPSLVPVKYGTTEPFRDRFDSKRIEEMAKRMLSGFYEDAIHDWTTNIKSGSGGVALQYGRGKRTAILHFSADSKDLEFVSSMQHLFKDVVSFFGATYGCLHYYPELEVKQLSKVHPNVAITSRWQLVMCLPDMLWANVFGPEYVEMFGGRDRMLSAPAFIVEELAENTFYLQLSEGIFDLELKPEQIRETRQRLKQHLGEDCFFDSRQGYETKYRVPVTGWEEPVRPPLTAEALMKMMSGKE